MSERTANQPTAYQQPFEKTEDPLSKQQRFP